MNWQFRRCRQSRKGEVPPDRWWQRSLSGGVAALMVAGFQSVGLLAPLEQMTYRIWFQLRGSQAWDSRLVVIAIDEAAMEEFERVSPSREQYAKLLDILAPAKPSVVVLNILTNQPSPSDEKVAEAMQNVPTLLTMAWNKEGQMKLPSALLYNSAIAIGHVVSTADSDGITRKVAPEIKGIPALGVASYQVYQRLQGDRACNLNNSPHSDRCFALDLLQPLWVNWPGSKNQLAEYSFTDVVRGKVARAAFTDKIVLVGATVRGFDPIQTPFNLNPPASDIHLHAAIVSNLLQNNVLHPLLVGKNPVISLIGYLLAGAVTSYAIAPWRLRRQMAIAPIAIAGWCILSFLLFQANYLLPVASPVMLLSLTTVAVALQDRFTIKARLRLSEQKLWQQVFYDALTGLPNRTLLLQRLEQATSRSKWDNSYLFAVLFIELDRFKVINTHRDHTISDQLLVAIASRIQACLGEVTDSFQATATNQASTLARFGGDTFTILLENLHSLEEAIAIAEQVYDTLSSPLPIDGQEVFCTVSIGIAASSESWRKKESLEVVDSNSPPDLNPSQYALYSSIAKPSTGDLRRYEEPETILRDAEIAMYQAKFQGKARYAVFNNSLYNQALGLLQLETDLRRAIAETDSKLNRVTHPDSTVSNPQATISSYSIPYTPSVSPIVQTNNAHSEFRLEYQPIVSLEHGKIDAFEALVRWHHPKRGTISPVEFIPLAEETGLIASLGWWILREACYQLRTWHQLFPSRLPVSMVVNLSAVQLKQSELKEQIQFILQETNIDSSYLKLEITESGLMENADTTVVILEQLRALGIQLSIDDFGTGYSSLGRLHYLPVNTLKIDQSFIRRTKFEGESWEIVQTIITLAHNLNMTVVAEGVETAEQVAQLKQLQCDYGQGYFFSRPLTAVNAIDLLQSDPQW